MLACWRRALSKFGLDLWSHPAVCDRHVVAARTCLLPSPKQRTPATTKPAVRPLVAPCSRRWLRLSRLRRCGAGFLLQHCGCVLLTQMGALGVCMWVYV